MKYKIIKKGKKYYEQEETEIDVPRLKSQLNFWKNKKTRLIEEAGTQCDSKIEALEAVLNNLSINK